MGKLFGGNGSELVGEAPAQARAATLPEPRLFIVRKLKPGTTELQEINVEGHNIQFPMERAVAMVVGSIEDNQPVYYVTRVIFNVEDVEEVVDFRTKAPRAGH